MESREITVYFVHTLLLGRILGVPILYNIYVKETKRRVFYYCPFYRGWTSTATSTSCAETRSLGLTCIR